MSTSLPMLPFGPNTACPEHDQHNENTSQEREEGIEF
jgi:hypothetical protein